MDAEKYGRRVALLCPVCGSSTFEFDEDDETVPIKCVDCGRETTREDLVEASGENIESHLTDMGEEFVADAAKEINKSLKQAFKGSKNIRFK